MNYSFVHLRSFYQQIINAHPKSGRISIPPEIRAESLYAGIYNIFMVNKMDKNRTTEGIWNKWVLIRETWDIMLLIRG